MYVGHGPTMQILKGIQMKDLKTNLLRFHQRVEMKDEIRNLDEGLKHAQGEDVGILMNRRRKAQKQLDSQSPEPLTGAEKDKLNLLEKKLRDRITHNMPTDEVMRKNPTGAVDWHQRWEKATKPLVRMWKNVRIQLNPDNEDRDLANIERYRPIGAISHGLRADAQISGHMSYGNISDEEWPFAKPENTALDQARKRYDEEAASSDVNAALERMSDQESSTESDGHERGFGPKGDMTAEEYADVMARLQKARDARSKKLAEQKQTDEAMTAAQNVAAE